MMNETLSLWGLFLSAFLSSTILPGSSEVVLGTLTMQGEFSAWSLLGIATLGNTLGGMSSWGLGCLLSCRYPMVELTERSSRLAVDRLRRWGSPVLLLSWVPVIGDPLCVAGGWLRMNWCLSLVYIGTGKGLRYATLLGVLSPGGVLDGWSVHAYSL